MNTKQTGYGEPWSYVSDGIYCDFERNDGSAIVMGEDDADYERAAVCVNACIGLSDPQKEIAEMRERIAELTHKGEQLTHVLGVTMMEGVGMRSAITSAVDCLAGLDGHLPGNHGMFLLYALEKLQPFIK